MEMSIRDLNSPSKINEVLKSLEYSNYYWNIAAHGMKHENYADLFSWSDGKAEMMKAAFEVDMIKFKKSASYVSYYAKRKAGHSHKELCESLKLGDSVESQVYLKCYEDEK